MSPDSHRSPQDHVRIQLLGGFGVTIGGRAIPEHEFGRRIARQLLKLIAIQSNASLHREQILDTLWPHLEPEAGAAQLYKAIHHVRRAFATVVPKSTADSLFSLKEQVLTLEAEELSVDAHLFLEDAHAKDSAGAATLLELYRGDLLPADRYEEWTLELREELTQRASDLRLLLGEQCLHEERWDDAEVRFREVLEQDEVSEAAWLGWMQVLARRGDRGRLKKELTKCRQILTEFTGEAPDKVFEDQVAALLEIAGESATQDQEASGATLRKSESTN
ncbi:MAG: hypothetical protein HKN21_07690, partial [Candidatus Eisenbacteria bacterium]|nr:hypothetical protein [Candidatus Eisenbacteria bacterium]